MWSWIYHLFRHMKSTVFSFLFSNQGGWGLLDCEVLAIRSQLASVSCDSCFTKCCLLSLCCWSAAVSETDSVLTLRELIFPQRDRHYIYGYT